MTFALEAIGELRTPFTEKAQCPRQPRAAEDVEGQIVLHPEATLRDALSDLEGWEFLWVLFWFDRAGPWRPKVFPPRSDRRRGVFSTRSPHRPNPIGLSVVRLLRVEDCTLHIRGVDMLDRSPVLDLKPYVPWADAIPQARTGWLSPPENVATHHSDATPRPADVLDAWTVELTPLARCQFDFLAAHGLALQSQAEALLRLGPHPHAYRRIRRIDDQLSQLALKDWRVHFSVQPPRSLLVHALIPGWSPRELHTSTEPRLALAQAFVKHFGWSSIASSKVP